MINFLRPPWSRSGTVCYHFPDKIICYLFLLYKTCMYTLKYYTSKTYIYMFQQSIQKKEETPEFNTWLPNSSFIHSTSKHQDSLQISKTKSSTSSWSSFQHSTSKNQQSLQIPKTKLSTLSWSSFQHST